MKWKDPFSYQSSVRKRLERDTFSHNVFSLSFGKHVAAYKGYVEAQDYLSKKSQDLNILTRALRRLPRLKNVTVVFKNEIIGARELMLAFGLLNGNEVTRDAEYTLSVLIEALHESDRKLDTFNLFSDDGPSLHLFSVSRRDFNDRHEPRFKYVSESPANVTAKALWDAFRGGDDNKPRFRAMHLMRRLREFNMSGLEIDCNDSFVFERWSHSLEPIVAFADRLEELSIAPTTSGAVVRSDQNLNLSSILNDSSSFKFLRYITLRHVESPESLLVALFTQCSRTLVNVALFYVRVSRGGSWSDVLRKSRNADFNVLYDFLLLHCGEAKDVIRAQRYLKRITDKDPIAESSEEQNDDSD